ncbi:MAG TPA: GNAT family N-acetyltransferase [Vicinamibacterales bacterium]|nr:GNAT family N-acetyltransferase [Vicinamibacterales bacterium]
MPSGPMLIRAATADDADALTDLAHRAKAHWGYPASWMREWDPQLTIIPGYLEAHDVWVAERDGAIVGMCALEDRGSRWSLEHVWVEPSAHRGGIGRALVMQALGEARRRHSGVVELLADPYATGFYERLGARRAGDVPAPMPGARRRTLPMFEFDLDAI